MEFCQWCSYNYKLNLNNDVLAVREGGALFSGLRLCLTTAEHLVNHRVIRYVSARQWVDGLEAGHDLSFVLSGPKSLQCPLRSTMGSL